MRQTDEELTSISPADLMHVAEDVARSGRRQVVCVKGKAIALEPDRDEERDSGRAARPEGKRSRRPPGALTPDDTFWDIVGIGCSEGAGDVSEHKHDYLFGAYLPPHA